MQAVGIVASVGDSVKHIKVGTSVALMTFGSYAEFVLVLLSMTCHYTTSMVPSIATNLELQIFWEALHISWIG
jgi:NADPH:quinone reductase-like Zn-dependent oxidoreductase